MQYLFTSTNLDFSNWQSFRKKGKQGSNTKQISIGNYRFRF